MTDRELLERLARAVSYDPLTGVITWLPRSIKEPDSVRWNSRYANKEAGTLEENGYVRIVFQVNGKKHKFRSHRLAWFISTGEPPQGEIDHINQIKTDNRISNLRDVSKSLNQRNSARKSNNTSGITGVTWHRQTGKWCAQANINGKHHHLGLFEEITAAETAARKFRLANGFTETHGRSQS